MKSLQNLYCRMDGKAEWTHWGTATILKQTNRRLVNHIFKDRSAQVCFVIAKKS